MLYSKLPWSQRNSYEYNHCTPPLLNFGEYPKGSGDEMRARTGMLFRHAASKMKGEETWNKKTFCAFACDGACMHDWLPRSGESQRELGSA